MSSSSPIIFEQNEDELKKKRIRQMQNRQSAAQYRERKKEYLDKLESVVEQLETERNTLISNTEKLAQSQNEVNLKISMLEEKIDLSLKKNRELKSTLAQLAKSSGVQVNDVLVQEQLMLEQQIQMKLTSHQPQPQQQQHYQTYQQMQHTPPHLKANTNSFNLEGNRSILNNESTSPSSSASSSPINNTQLTLTDSNEKQYIDKFSTISISSLSSSGERDHPHSNNSSLDNDFKSSHHLNSFKIESPSLKYQQQKRTRDMLPELISASNSSGVNGSLNNSLSSSGGAPPGIGSPSLYTSPSPSPSLSFSPLTTKLPSLSSSASNNNINLCSQSYTPPLASFSSILSIASPSSSPLISSLSSSPSSCYLGSSISSDTFSNSSNTTTTTNSSTNTYRTLNDSYSNSPSQSRYKSYLK